MLGSLLLDLHHWWAWVVVLGNGVVGAWALAAHRYPRLRTPVLWWCTGAAEVAVVVQAVLGVAVQQREDLEAPGLHAFYGFVAIASVGIIYSYRQQIHQHLYLLYGLGGLFLMGLGIRAMILA